MDFVLKQGILYQKKMNLVTKNDESYIKNDQSCIENDE